MAELKEVRDKETPQDVIARLEKEYVAAIKVLDEAKEKVVAAQDKAFRALQELAGFRERFYIAVIQDQNKKIEEQAKPVKSATPEPKKKIVVTEE